MKQLLWIAALGAAMLGGCAKQHGAGELAGTPGEGAATRHFTNTTPLRQRSLTPLSTPMYFEQNVGQTDAQVRFLSRGPSYSVFLTRSGPVFSLAATSRAPVACKLPSCAKAARKADVVRMAFANANPDPATEGVDRQPGKSHYFIGNDRNRWHSNVAHFAKVRYRKVYPGVDVLFYGNQSKLEYDFVVAPGANPRQIALDLDGVRSMRVDPAGDLVLSTAGGELVQHRPIVYQQIGGQRIAVEGRYALKTRTRVGFELGRYDARAPLVIDPMFGFSTYLGGSAGDAATAVVVDAEGNTYVVGRTNSMDLVPGEIHDTGYVTVVFVTKFDVIGNVLYTTYLGGSSGGDTGDSIAVDAIGRAYVAGATCSEDFPVVNAAQDHLAGVCDAFVARLAADGSALDYATYFGGSGNEPYDGYDTVEDRPSTVHVAVDAGGNAYFTGGTGSMDLPVVNALQSEHRVDPAYAGYPDAFLAKLGPDGGTVVYATYLGGSRGDTATGIAVDGNGNAYVVGRTNSPDFPVVSPMQAALATEGYDDAFVAEISADGTSLVYSTFLGGSYYDRAAAVAVDAAGSAYVTGFSNSPEFPFSVFPTDCPGLNPPTYAHKAFVAKVAPLGQGLSYNACLKGADPYAIAVDASGNVYLTGYTSSAADFPTVDPMQPNPSPWGDTDAFVSKLEAGGATLLFSTYLGGSSADMGNGIAVDAGGIVHVVGATSSDDFPTTSGLGPLEIPVSQSRDNGFVATIQDGIELSIDDFRALEGGNGPHQISFNVHLSSASPAPVTFDLDTADLGSAVGDATEGVDYEGVHARGLVFQPGETDKAITMTLYGDTVPEPGAAGLAYPGESFVAAPSNVAGAVLRDLSAVGTIGNDDAVLSIDDVSMTEGTDVNTNVSIPVRLSAPVASRVNVYADFIPGSARPNDDYYASIPEWVVIEPGSVEGYAEVGVTGDSLIEPDEDFSVALHDVDGAVLGDASSTVTILNDDFMLSIADASVVEGNSGTRMANFTVSLGRPASTPVQFSVWTQNGTAAAGSDYTETYPTRVTIPAGSANTTVSIPVIGDSAVEANETFKVRIGDVIAATLGDSEATGTILNDDTKLSIADVSVVEGNSGSKLATFTVKLSNTSAQAVTFNVATANKSAAAGTDYVAKSLSGQSIVAGATSKTFTVSITGDKTVEANETFLVNVSNVAGGTVSDSQAIGTIRNDDALLTIADASVTEGNSGTKTLSFTVRLSAASASPVTFNIATANKTAMAGSDYVARSLKSQVIAAGGTSKVFTVMLNGDRARETNETFLVNVTGIVGATVKDGQAIGTIVNDD